MEPKTASDAEAIGRPGTPQDGSAPPQLHDLESAALDVLAANRDMRIQLDAYDFVIEECLEKYRAGMKLLDSIMTLPPANATIGSELEAVHVFEARRELRRALVITLLAEGMAVKKISAIFNVPLQSVTDIAGAIGKPID